MNHFTKRSFLKVLPACVASMPTFLKLAKSQRTYLDSVPMNETVGLRFEHLGKEWVIADKMPSVFEWEGQHVCNFRMDKYVAIPVGRDASPLLLCFNAAPWNGCEGRWDLSYARPKLYKA